MTPATFKEVTHRFGVGQSEYFPLSGHYRESDGVATFCWKLSDEDLEKLKTNGGVIWHQVMTFGQPLQPVNMFVDKPNLQANMELL